MQLCLQKMLHIFNTVITVFSAIAPVYLTHETQTYLCHSLQKPIALYFWIITEKFFTSNIHIYVVEGLRLG